MNPDPGEPAGGLQGAQAEDDCSGADMCCNIRVDRNSTQQLCSSTAGDCEPKNPLMLSVWLQGAGEPSPRVYNTHPAFCATGEPFNPGCSSSPCCRYLNNLRKLEALLIRVPRTS